ncbi:Hypothetical protein SMAX5B_010263 [Scophthalmus maximus]|uniref:Uncharacterized protein n=1 Tax=Scophthalmus maximus TaxID=52904 RepID=A0A2U9CAV1_SCOMX|nr:Hypothetical protein SMAX5B_010263 [Scophthalmus maximus]
MQPRSKVPKMVRGSNRDVSKEGPRTAPPQQPGRIDCQQENSPDTFRWGSQRGRLVQNPRTYVITPRAEQDTHLQRMVEELQLEREKKKTLQEEVERFRTLYEADGKCNEAGVRQLVDDFDRELDKEIKPHGDLVSKNLPLLHNPAAERDDGRQKMAGDLQVERETETILQEELDRVRISCQEDRQRYEADMLTVTQRADDLQQGLDFEIKSRAERESQDKKLLQKLRAERNTELQEERRNKQILQEELDRVRASCQEDRQVYEAQVLTLMQRADDLQQGLDFEIKSCTKRESQYKICLQKLRAKLQDERKNRQILHKELDSIRASSQEDRQRYEDDILTVTESFSELQQALDTEIESCAERESQHETLLQKLRAEQDAELQQERKNKQVLQEELDRVRASCQEDRQRCEADVLTERQRADDLQEELDKLQTPTRQKASNWKRVRHFLRPQRWKTPK